LVLEPTGTSSPGLNFFPLCTTYNPQVLRPKDPTKKKPSVQLCTSSNSCWWYTTSVPISRCIDRSDETTRSKDYYLHGFDPSQRKHSSSGTASTETAVDSKNFHPQVLHLQPTAVDQVCSPRAFQAPLQTPSLVDATPLHRFQP